MKKCLKSSKNIKKHKHTKNHNHITCCSSDRMRTRFLPNLGHFLFFYPIFGPKKSKSKQTPRDVIILHTLRCLIYVGVKTNVEVRTFQRNINHSFIIVWFSILILKAFPFFKIAHVRKMSHNNLFLN